MSRFKLQYQVAELHLRQVFTISRGSKATVKNVMVQLQSKGITGYGEAAPNTRYGEDAAKVIAYVEALPDNFFDEIATAEELVKKLDRQEHRDNVNPVQSARVAVEMAWLDWWGKAQDKPLLKLWETPTNIGPVTSFTIGLDELDVMQQKVEQATAYPVLKVKLGTDRDRQIINALREVTDKPLRVDANEGWKTLDEAKAAIDFLAEQNIEMVEQPMPADQLKDMVALKAYSPIPLCADESFEGQENLEEIARAFDIINIKLMKTGSIVKARQIISRAGETRLKVMIGCMIESSLANTAGAILSLWADYADLDGHLLIADDPYQGLQLDEKKRIVLRDRPGLGVVRRKASR
ncbi:dipeptide epimerase [Aliifodinibius sp. S!AR15-10]|uniref:dipeptide epimerase n=1 Tax=Aliifodinibius sp. S!AR15-10 TaxID=2950437 RepID=UPI0028584E17|nr:dipeptide epimerase [Aliifodinibius sp. S!AR15-10]MDR8393087.1 dipeptide epimerase [Aliifodinibius sp. S!AR15-10]